MQKKIVVHMYLKNGKAVTGFDENDRRIGLMVIFL